MSDDQTSDLAPSCLPPIGMENNSRATVFNTRPRVLICARRAQMGYAFLEKKEDY